MMHSFETMGTVVSIEPRMRQMELEEIFAEHDAAFSLYRASSELSRIAAGSLTLPNASETVRDAYTLALEWRALTNGIFTPHRPDGVLDLSGIVKALAMDAAGRLLCSGEDRSSEQWILNVGGDVVTSGCAATVGIVDPIDRQQLLTAVRLRGDRRAVATSGSAERGEHIWGRGGFVQATVIADDIITADVLATTIVAGGTDSLNHANANWDIDVLAIDREGNLFATPGFRSSIAEAAPTR